MSIPRPNTLDLTHPLPALCDGAPGLGFCPTAARATEVVTWMPDYLRASHEAARDCGVWPDNGAERLHLCEDCADSLEECDSEWTERESGRTDD